VTITGQLDVLHFINTRGDLRQWEGYTQGRNDLLIIKKSKHFVVREVRPAGRPMEVVVTVLRITMVFALTSATSVSERDREGCSELRVSWGVGSWIAQSDGVSLCSSPSDLPFVLC
jgi:hypothetical protein